MKRWTAYVKEVRDVVNADVDEKNIIKINGSNIKRVKIMGSVVSKFISDDKNYGFLIIDDGTETIRVRSFEDKLNLIQKSNLGDVVEIIGMIKIYQDEIYISPEIIRKIENPNELILRKLKIMKGKIEDKKNQKFEVVEEKIETKNKKEEVSNEQKNSSDNPRSKFIKLVRKYDTGKGVEISKIKEEFKDENLFKKIMKDLLNEGELFEPMPEKIKILE